MVHAKEKAGRERRVRKKKIKITLHKRKLLGEGGGGSQKEGK